MKEYSKGIYVKFKPEEVEILHDRMKEAGVQNMSAYIRKMALNGYVIIPECPSHHRGQRDLVGGLADASQQIHQGNERFP